MGDDGSCLDMSRVNCRRITRDPVIKSCVGVHSIALTIKLTFQIDMCILLAAINQAGSKAVKNRLVG